VALFQVSLPDRRLCFVDSELSAVKARFARDAADILASRGRAVVVLTINDLENALGDRTKRSA
jgi:hypothetical protein